MANAQEKVLIRTQKVSTQDLARNPAAGTRELDYAEITSLPLATYFQKSGRFLNTTPMRYYDTAPYVAGTAITPAMTAQLFRKGIGSPASIVNTGASIGEKRETLTNMIGDGEFENGTTFIMEGIEAKVSFGMANGTTYTAGELRNPAVVAVADFSAYLHLSALLTQMKLSFTRGGKQQPMFSGLLEEFPPSNLVSGAFGDVADGFVQNFGANDYNKMTRARVLESQEKFSVQLEPLALSFMPQVPFNIRVTLVGKAIETLYE